LDKQNCCSNIVVLYLSCNKVIITIVWYDILKLRQQTNCEEVNDVHVLTVVTIFLNEG